jgi:1,4-alpha-glucan branching enzyme
MKPSGRALEALLEGTHADPFALLGIHEGPGGAFARAVLPGAETAEAFTLAGASLGTLARSDARGLFEGAVSGPRQPVRYRCTAHGHEWWQTDAYSFGPVLGPTDDFLIAEGTHLRLFDKIGAHVIDHEGARGVHFAVWAPNAQLVTVVGDFNGWDHRRHPMRRRADIGVWEMFVPDIGAGNAYKFRITGPDGTVLPLKADPFAFASELRPATASVIAEVGKPDWGDAAHRAHWAKTDPRRAPMAIYEVHAGFHQGADERDVARQPVQLGDDQHSTMGAGGGQSLVQLGAISTLAAFDFHKGSNLNTTNAGQMALNGFALRLQPQAAAPLLVSGNSGVGHKPHISLSHNVRSEI